MMCVGFRKRKEAMWAGGGMRGIPEKEGGHVGGDDVRGVPEKEGGHVDRARSRGQVKGLSR